MSKLIAGAAVLILSWSAYASEPKAYTDSEFISELSKVNAIIDESKERYLSQYQIEDLLRDPSPQIRKAAVKNSKSYILNNSIYEKVIYILKNRSELLDIRIEAARTLCYATGYSEVRDALKDIIRYEEKKELKIMAYKALWTATNYSEIKDFLLDAVRYNEREEELKQAAVWALFSVSPDYNVRNRLIEIARNTNESEVLRIEAIKSLYSASGYYEVKDKLIDIVKYSNEEKSIKLIAIKALAGANNDSNVKSFLDDIIRWGNDEELKVAAIWASNPSISEINELFHLPYRLHTGIIINPIEKE